MRILLLFLVACGPTGGFQLQNRNYSADKITVERLDSEGLEGVIVTLRADPISSAVDDEVAVAVSVYWNPDQRPSLNQDVSVGKELAVRALPRVSCFCGSNETPLVAPEVKGKFRLARFNDTDVAGDFDLTFVGQVPFAGGGVLYENETLKVNASGWSLTP